MKLVFQTNQTFLFLIQTQHCNHSSESSRRDDYDKWSHCGVWMRYKGDILENVLSTDNQQLPCILYRTALS